MSRIYKYRQSGQDGLHTSVSLEFCLRCASMQVLPDIIQPGRIQYVPQNMSMIYKYRQSGQDVLHTSMSLEFCLCYSNPAGKGCKFFLI